MNPTWEVHDLTREVRYTLGGDLFGATLRYVTPEELRARGLDDLVARFAADWLAFLDLDADHADPDDLAYPREVAGEVWAFCEAAAWNVEVVPVDDDHAGPRSDWPVVGTRWRGVELPSPEEQMRRRAAWLEEWGYLAWVGLPGEGTPEPFRRRAWALRRRLAALTRGKAG